VTTLGITINGRAHGALDVRDDLSMNDFLREHLGMPGQVPKLEVGMAVLRSASTADATRLESEPSPRYGGV
jgi:aerobic-type carbon monoxide dehydrogenase small subunit (CoxS/CutS family)